MKKRILLIEIAVGYMLKVIKSDKKIIKFKQEFAAIRHGDYYSFINLMNGKLPFMITYNKGNIYEDNKNNEADFDFAGLIKSGNSLVIFYNNCIEYYGEIIDAEIPDKIYCKLAYFELSLRMHSRNNNLVQKTAKLKVIIDAIGAFKNLTASEISDLHSGRKFLNMVKHSKKPFNTWEVTINSFLNALDIIDRHKLTIL